MNLVWPWYVSEQPESLVDKFGRDAGPAPSLELRCPRTDGDASLVVWAESSPAGPSAPAGVSEVGAGWARSVASAHGCALVDHFAMVVDGLRGYSAEIADGRFRVRRMVFPLIGRVAHFLVTVPDGHAAAYWCHVDTMLSTWSWEE